MKTLPVPKSPIVTVEYLERFGVPHDVASSFVASMQRVALLDRLYIAAREGRLSDQTSGEVH